jgi:hypothetical protein
VQGKIERPRPEESLKELDETHPQRRSRPKSASRSGASAARARQANRTSA